MTIPSGSVDNCDGAGALEEGYDTLMEARQDEERGVSSSLSRRSPHLTKNITSSDGRYLPNMLTEM